MRRERVGFKVLRLVVVGSPVVGSPVVTPAKGTAELYIYLT